ncbi:hypothetical protein SpCBS45565_g03183 [Spizellomyces sp. 'palustris']|nr:hypothetical protein SpCBS45565_g03183 [Spizellomyces sp. 'palustris']
MSPSPPDSSRSAGGNNKHPRSLSDTPVSLSSSQSTESEKRSKPAPYSAAASPKWQHSSTSSQKQTSPPRRKLQPTARPKRNAYAPLAASPSLVNDQTYSLDPVSPVGVYLGQFL